MKKILLICGRERGLFIIKELTNNNVNISGVIIMKDDPHEIPWSEKIGELSKSKNIPYEIGKSFNNDNILNFYKELEPHIVFTENWRTMIPRSIYEKAKHFVVFHESLLPKYRGFAPLSWPIINGESETGVTMFYIGEDVDAGPIIDRYKIPIKHDDSCNELYLKTFDAYLNLCLKNIPRLINDDVQTKLQNENDATFACMRTPDDGWIDWSKSAKQIHNFIRALKPPLLPGAFTFYNGNKIVIISAEISVIKDKYVGKIPGRIIKIDDDSVYVLCGDGIIKIKEAKLENSDSVEKASKIFNKMKIKIG